MASAGKTLTRFNRDKSPFCPNWRRRAASIGCDNLCRRGAYGGISARGLAVITSIRLALTSLAVCCMTVAASGMPLSFSGRPDVARAQQAYLLAPENLDAHDARVFRPLDPAAHTLSSSARQ